jgi:hypothetical protein
MTTTNNNFDKLKYYLLALGKDEVLVITKKDGTRDYYTYSMLSDDVIKKAEGKNLTPGFKFFFLEEDEL